jgi:hypothetical protein
MIHVAKVLAMMVVFGFTFGAFGISLACLKRGQMMAFPASYWLSPCCYQ